MPRAPMPRARMFHVDALLPVLALMLVAILAACAPRTVPSEVTRFSAAPNGPQPGTFTIYPVGEQRGSLEFQSYAELVADELARRGFRPVAADAAAAADYAVFLSWGVGEATTEFRAAPATVFGGTSVYGSHTGFGIGMGFPLGTPTHVEATSTRTKWLRVVMRPGGAGADASLDALHQAPNVFEGRAIITGASASIQPVMPYLVEALFTNFPGRSGQTERVRVPIR